MRVGGVKTPEGVVSKGKVHRSRGVYSHVSRSLSVEQRQRRTDLTHTKKKKKLKLLPSFRPIVSAVLRP